MNKQAALKSQFFIFILIGGISIQLKILVLGALGFNQLFVYIFSCLFTLSAVCLLFEFSCKNIDFCKVFCQNFVFKRLIFTLLFTFVSCLFTFCQLFVYFLSAVCLLFKFSSKNIEKSWLFCQNFESKFLIF